MCKLISVTTIFLCMYVFVSIFQHIYILSKWWNFQWDKIHKYIYMYIRYVMYCMYTIKMNEYFVSFRFVSLYFMLHPVQTRDKRTHRERAKKIWDSELIVTFYQSIFSLVSTRKRWVFGSLNSLQINDKHLFIHLFRNWKHAQLSSHCS